MKTAIVYYSKHHSNTKKLLDAIAKNHDVTLIDAIETPNADLSCYDLVGFASGIYYSKFHKSVLQFAEKNLPQAKKVFFLYTYGAEKRAIPMPSPNLLPRRTQKFSGNTAASASIPSAPSSSSVALPRVIPILAT